MSTVGLKNCFAVIDYIRIFIMHKILIACFSLRDMGAIVSRSVRKWGLWRGKGDKLFRQIGLENELVYKWAFNWLLFPSFEGGLCYIGNIVWPNTEMVPDWGVLENDPKFLKLSEFARRRHYWGKNSSYHRCQAFVSLANALMTVPCEREILWF